MSRQSLFAAVDISSAHVGFSEFTGQPRARPLRAVRRIGDQRVCCGCGALYQASQHARRPSGPGPGLEPSGGSRAVCRSRPRGVCDSTTPKGP